jgi:hypothetical protein
MVDQDPEAAGGFEGDLGHTDPTPPARRSSKVLWLAIALGAVVVAFAVAVVLLLGATVPKGDLEDAEAELASVSSDLADTRATLADTEQTAAADRTSATEREAGLDAVVASLEDDVDGLEGDVSGLRTDVSGLEGELSERNGELAASQADVETLSTDLATEQDRAEAAEDTLDAAGDSIRESFQRWEWMLTWALWTDPGVVRSVERDKADVTGYDALVDSLGLAETWKALSRRDGSEVARELDILMDLIDDGDVQVAFDEWFDCDSRRSCVQTAIALDAGMMKALTDQLLDLAAVLEEALILGPEL